MSLHYFDFDDDTDYFDDFRDDFEDHLMPWSDEPIEDDDVDDFWDKDEIKDEDDPKAEDWYDNPDVFEDLEAHRRMMFANERREGALWKEWFIKDEFGLGLRRKAHRVGFDTDFRKRWRDDEFRFWYRHRRDWTGHMDWHLDRRSMIDLVDLDDFQRDCEMYGFWRHEIEEAVKEKIEKATFEDRMALDWDIDREAEKISGGVYREPSDYYDLLDWNDEDHLLWWQSHHIHDCFFENEDLGLYENPDPPAYTESYDF